MKKILFLTFVVGLIANCYSIDKTKVGGKDVITATQMNPVIFTAWGAPVTACLNDLNKEGATQVVDARGAATGGMFSTSRISGTEACQATGVK
ncbi:hypothetical protein LEP1GSC060_0170 [Leptospira weilii serovar Ranarum str. ICFT]|uniref:Uncharacterized protein n=1 Tax=Leptospira weilii serovar Ranarum str. ICFT TaxID=1218598 RepID=N1WF14_9LEPT|nr:hypothetical protein [Leptospira weilii]EMY77535.1 hypothetical protein LEP1GSC060_0170 [Leptospira weilii serovar Ranarum str. ICFT]